MLNEGTWKYCHFNTLVGKKASVMLAGHVRKARRVGHRTGLKYRECLAKIGTVGSYEIVKIFQPLLLGNQTLRILR